MTTPTITRLKLPALRSWIQSQPWAIQPEAGQQLLAYLELRATGQATEDMKPRAARGSGPVITKNGGAIAVLPLYGAIAQRMDMMMSYCGGTSAERFADEFDAAMADTNVSAIVIDCDSPGGNVQGTPELAKRIYAARGKGKKLIAVSNGQMCSAAYWICSACDEIVGSPSSDTGSIGVFCVHLDESAYNEALGLKYTIIKAGEHKAEGNPWEPLSADAEAYIQDQVDEMYGDFIAAVAKHRGVSSSKVTKDFGQGRTMTAKQALSAGLIDRIATIEETLTRLGAKDVGMSGRPKRALGASAATINDQRQVVGPTLLSTGVDVRADDAAPETVPDPAVCPDCGGDLDQDANCTKCEYTTPAKADDDDDDTSARAGGAAATSEQLPDHRPDAAIEETAMDINAAVAAERARATAITKLGKKHKIADAQIEAMIADDLTIDQAASRILGEVEARGAASPTIRVGADREADRPFASVGEQLFAVVSAGKAGGRVDPRLRRVNAQAMEFVAGSPDGMNESTGSEGGFFIQSDLLPGVIEPVYQDDPILSRAKRVPIGNGNGVKYNVIDETSRADGSRFGGLSMQWVDENDSPTVSKPKLRRVELALKKLIGGAYLTEELQQDAPAAQALLLDAFQTELRFRLSSAMWRGNGVGQPLGFLNSGAVVSQAIEAAQTIANTAASLYMNVAKMMMHIPAGLQDDVIWLYNPELLPYLLGATVGSSSIPVFVPFAGFTEAKGVDRILGRPAFMSEQAEAVGTAGDIVAICPSQYHVAEKGGPQVASSIHVKFLSGENTLRIMYRFDAQPMWVSSVTPYKGAAARSPYITLAARS